MRPDPCAEASQGLAIHRSNCSRHKKRRSISSATWALVRVRRVSSKVWCLGWGVFHRKVLMSAEFFLLFPILRPPSIVGP